MMDEIQPHEWAGEVTWQHQTRVVLGGRSDTGPQIKRYHLTSRL
jgi:hypothetical protein